MRGSLHAHIMLWLDPNQDLEAIFNEITASYPCTYKQDHDGTLVPDIPTSPAEPGAKQSVVSELCQLVAKKQQHRCATSRTLQQVHMQHMHLLASQAHP
jgi:hypothetical protein